MASQRQLKEYRKVMRYLGHQPAPTEKLIKTNGKYRIGKCRRKGCDVKASINGAGVTLSNGRMCGG